MTFSCSLMGEDVIARNNNNAVFEERFETQEEWHAKWDKDEITYAVIRDTEDIPDEAGEVLAMNLAMTTWDLEVPNTLQVVRKSNNPDITVEFASSEQESYFKDRPGVLAFAYFPGQGSYDGIIKFNDDYRWSLDGKPEPAPYNPNTKFKTYNLIHVMIHEIGHSLGLRHSESMGHVDVMDPYYNGTVLDLSQEDISRVVSKYGKRVWPATHHYDRMKRWLAHRVRRF